MLMGSKTTSDVPFRSRMSGIVDDEEQGWEMN